MTGRSIVALCLYLSVTIAYGQNVAQIKKLRHDLIAADDQHKFDILTDLAWEYRASHPDSGIYFGQQAYHLGIELNSHGLARPLNFTGVAFNHKGNHLDAYEYYHRALETAEERDDSLQIAHACNNLGRLFLEQGILTKAHRFLERGRLIFETLKDYPSLAYACQSLAGYNAELKNLQQAEFNLRKAIEIRMKISDKPQLLSSVIQLGKFYADHNRVGEALVQFGRADSLASLLRDELYLAEIRNHKGQCEMIRGNLSAAETLLLSGIATIEASGNTRLLPDAYLTMGQVQFKKNNFIRAKEYFTDMLKVSALRKDLKVRMEANFFLWQTLKKQNQDQTATVDHYTQYLVLRDSLRTLENDQRTAQLKFHTEIEKREKENEILRIRNFQKTSIILVLAVIIVLIGIHLYTQIKFRTKILKINHQLEDRNQAIRNFNTILNDKRITLEKHIHTLGDLSRNPNIQTGLLQRALQDIIKVVCANLKVNRASIWMYNDQKQCIETAVLYDAEADVLLEQLVISYDDAPRYFEAIKQDKIIIAEDARTHPSTSEFTDHYLMPNDIHSLLDATFYQDDKLKGLLCCEQKHEPRQWTAEDRIFVSTISEVISVACRTAERLEYEEAISRMNASLELRVKERTEELEDQNKKLMEYAFINSHVLRGPASRIMGLINLFEHARIEEYPEIINLLKKSSEELDLVVQKITAALHEGAHLTKEDFDNI